MTDWRPLFLCFRPDTKSKKPYAKCRQYIFYSIADLIKWLQARKNSTERIVVDYCPTPELRKHKIEGTRKELSVKKDWPVML